MTASDTQAFLADHNVLAKAGELQNEEMQQTKPAFFLDCAGFAADLRCSTDNRGRVGET